jgi:hypothetical protein
MTFDGHTVIMRIDLRASAGIFGRASFQTLSPFSDTLASIQSFSDRTDPLQSDSRLPFITESKGKS